MLVFKSGKIIGVQKYKNEQNNFTKILLLFK